MSVERTLYSGSELRAWESARIAEEKAQEFVESVRNCVSAETGRGDGTGARAVEILNKSEGLDELVCLHHVAVERLEHLDALRGLVQDIRKGVKDDKGSCPDWLVEMFCTPLGLSAEVEDALGLGLGFSDLGFRI